MKFDFCDSFDGNGGLKSEYVNQLWSTVNDKKCNVNIGISEGCKNNKNDLLIGFGVITIIYLGWKAYNKIYKPLKSMFTEEPKSDVKNKRSDLLMIEDRGLVLDSGQYVIIEDNN